MKQMVFILDHADAQKSFVLKALNVWMDFVNKSLAAKLLDAQKVKFVKKEFANNHAYQAMIVGKVNFVKTIFVKTVLENVNLNVQLMMIVELENFVKTVYVFQ